MALANPTSGDNEEEDPEGGNSVRRSIRHVEQFIPGLVHAERARLGRIIGTQLQMDVETIRNQHEFRHYHMRETQTLQHI